MEIGLAIFFVLFAAPMVIYGILSCRAMDAEIRWLDVQNGRRRDLRAVDQQDIVGR
jgi:hypothetical protein